MYITLDDIKLNRISEAKLIELTDDADLGVVDEGKVNGAIAGAADTINGFCRGRYALPLNPVPDSIVTIALDIATYNIYGLKPEFNVPKTVDDRYVTAMKLLTRVQDGKHKLYDEDVTPVKNMTAGGPSFVATTPVYTDENLKNF